MARTGVLFFVALYILKLVLAEAELLPSNVGSFWASLRNRQESERPKSHPKKKSIDSPSKSSTVEEPAARGFQRKRDSSEELEDSQTGRQRLKLPTSSRLYLMGLTWLFSYLDCPLHQVKSTWAGRCKKESRRRRRRRQGPEMGEMLTALLMRSPFLPSKTIIFEKKLIVTTQVDIGEVTRER